MKIAISASLIITLLCHFPRVVIAEEFAGLSFGLGLSMTYKYGKDRIYDATVANNIVRITKEANREPKIMLESHKFFEPKWLTSWCVKCGLGPFVAIQPGSDNGNVISAYSLGWMIGFKRMQQASEDSTSWNFGIGYIVNTDVKVLGDGIEENEPLPEGDSLRFKQRNQPGWMIITSFSF